MISEATSCLLTFGPMKTPEFVQEEMITIESKLLERKVPIDLYFNKGLLESNEGTSVLLVNDGQDLKSMDFATVFEEGLRNHHWPANLLIIGIHAGPLRKMEYGMSASTDYLGRGAKASIYTRFILEELLAIVVSQSRVKSVKDISIAGFSLGGLSALDISWNNPSVFSKVGVFSGALWWRSIDQDHPDYSDAKHRLMHNQVAASKKQEGVKFFFQCGTLDEKNDRNKNGIIDSIDDTLDLIKELKLLGYQEPTDLHYEEIAGGKHDIATWKKAWPAFIKWAYNS